MERDSIIQKIREVLKKNRVSSAYLFGSFARKEKRYKDIDVAITPPKGKFSLLDLIGIEQELEERVGRKFDLCTLDSIKPALKPYIKRDLVVVV